MVNRLFLFCVLLRAPNTPYSVMPHIHPLTHTHVHTQARIHALMEAAMQDVNLFIASRTGLAGYEQAVTLQVDQEEPAGDGELWCYFP